MSDSEIEERAWSYFLEASNDDGWISATRHGYAFEKLVELLGEFSKERDEIKVLLESLSKSTSERIKDLRSGHSTQSPKELADALRDSKPQPARMACPYCGIDHIDAGDWETRPHHKHLCLHCGKLFRFEGADGEYFYGVGDVRIEKLEAALREIRTRMNTGGHPGSTALQVLRLVDNALAGKAVLKPTRRAP